MSQSLLLDWIQAIDQVRTTGRAYAPGALSDALLGWLLGVELQWVELDERLPSGVDQQYAYAGLEPTASPATAELCRLITDGLAPMATAVGGLEQFTVNELSFHRYRPGDRGLGRHRDRAFYHYLVIGITLSGGGELHLFDGEQDDPVEIWHTKPGDLYLFRAPGLDGCGDGRPAHATGPTKSGRTSLTLRYNSHGFGGGWSTADEPGR